MARVPHLLALPFAALFAVGAAAQAPPIYRYVDPSGRVIYSDHMPPADAKDVKAKRLTQNYIETDKMALATKQARDHYPVTLYTYACGDICDKATALLNRRGVPYTTVNVTEAKGAEQLKKVSGGTQVPVLQAGDKLIAKGFSVSGWQALLDEAGYPKAPASRRTLSSLEVPKDAEPAQAPGPAPAPAPVRAPEQGGGYPKL